MHPARRPFVGGNWKMNTLREGAVELARVIAAGLAARPSVRETAGLAAAIPTTAPDGSGSRGGVCEVVLFPPFPWLVPVAEVIEGTTIGLGAQDLSSEASGAFTGQVSAEMIRDTGAEWVIIGHSERRHGQHESDAYCGEKLQIALDSGLRAVFCVGETWDERSGGHAHDVCRRQLSEGFKHIKGEALDRVVVAYEPVWAIGTGRTASPADAQASHRTIREFLGSLYDPQAVEALRILYGGSVNAANATALFGEPDIDGGLIGGASLKPADFLSIINATHTPVTAART